jgi:hypothetical protein
MPVVVGPARELKTAYRVRLQNASTRLSLSRTIGVRTPGMMILRDTALPGLEGEQGERTISTAGQARTRACTDHGLLAKARTGRSRNAVLG